MAPIDLHGSCACGRNRYIISIPDESSRTAQVFFDNSSSSRRLQASPLTAWLRVPLEWFQSATFAFASDENHQSIRRSFSLPFEENTRRQFCGYCGTQLSQWDGSSREAEEFVSLTLGSLLEEDLDKLDDLGILETEDDLEEEHQEDRNPLQFSVFKPATGVAHRGAPWFESIIQDTKLGRIRKQKGAHTSADGSVSVEWEVIEWTGADEGGEEETYTGKRKIGEVDAGHEDGDAMHMA